MKTFSGKILRPKVTILHFSHKNVGMILYTLYFSTTVTIVFYTGMKTEEHFIFEVIDFDPEKSKEKVVQDFWLSVYMKEMEIKQNSVEFQN